MNGHNFDFESQFPVVTKWYSVSKCPFARKAWVNPSNIDEEKSYKKGDFLRVFCEHDIRWCDAELGYEYCSICADHLRE